MSTLRLLVLAMLVSATSSSAQANASAAALARSLEGVWRVLDTRASDGTVTANQPGFRLFVGGYYSVVRVDGLAPRALESATATAEQLQAAWTPFTSNAGTYEVVDGQTITTRPLVAKNPSVMASGNFTTSTVRIVGDTLSMTNIRNQAGPVANAGVARWLRIRS